MFLTYPRLSLSAVFSYSNSTLYSFLVSISDVEVLVSPSTVTVTSGNDESELLANTSLINDFTTEPFAYSLHILEIYC